MGLLDGKVAFITGAARAQGRSHAQRLAAEGADIIAIDICAQAAPVAYPTATADDLDETARLVEKEGRAIIARVADVRDQAALDAAVADGVHAFGRLDIVVANAGISTWGRFWEMPDDTWQAMIDINLTGVWRTFKAAAPAMIAAGNGGSMIAIASVAGIKSLPCQAHYSAAKHGVVGLTKTAAIELGEYGIRVNSIHPWGVQSAMVEDPTISSVLADHPNYANSFGSILPVPQLAEPGDISDAVVYLASNLSRCVTGIQLPVDMGATTV
ncbi:MAG: putative NAD-dependent oxidoreductase [Ilumatobacteraceae bacterium]|nr:putative NAD-dependent oxidoreductase [Ilumatobacteraceae bacterium]